MIKKFCSEKIRIFHKGAELYAISVPGNTDSKNEQKTG